MIRRNSSPVKYGSKTSSSINRQPRKFSTAEYDRQIAVQYFAIKKKYYKQRLGGAVYGQLMDVIKDSSIANLKMQNYNALENINTMLKNQLEYGRIPVAEKRHVIRVSEKLTRYLKNYPNTDENKPYYL